MTLFFFQIYDILKNQLFSIYIVIYEILFLTISFGEHILYFPTIQGLFWVATYISNYFFESSFISWLLYICLSLYVVLSTLLVYYVWQILAAFIFVLFKITISRLLFQIYYGDLNVRCFFFCFRASSFRGKKSRRGYLWQKKSRERK